MTLEKTWRKRWPGDTPTLAEYLVAMAAITNRRVPARVFFARQDLAMNSWLTSERERWTLPEAKTEEVVAAMTDEARDEYLARRHKISTHNDKVTRPCAFCGLPGVESVEHLFDTTG